MPSSRIIVVPRRAYAICAVDSVARRVTQQKASGARHVGLTQRRFSMVCLSRMRSDGPGKIRVHCVQANRSFEGDGSVGFVSAVRSDLLLRGAKVYIEGTIC